MKVWVIGISGMLGSSIFSKLKEKKISCIGTTKDEANIRSLENLRNFLEVNDVTHIINCAAYTKVDDAEENSFLANATNAWGVRNIAIAAKKIKAKLMHFSTDYVFSGESIKPYKEDDIANPLSIYGQSKLQGEKFLFENYSSKDFCLIRTSWLFGYSERNFVSSIIEKMRKNEEIKIVDDQIGRPTFCENLADIAISMLNYSGIFHYADDTTISWYEFAKKIYEIAKKNKKKKLKCKKIIPVKTEDFLSLAKRPRYSVLDTKKIEKTLNIKPFSLDEALNSYINKTYAKKY